MQWIDAIEEVLRAAGKPLHYTDIAKRIIERQLVSSAGQHPSGNVNTTIGNDLRTGDRSRFVRVSLATYALREQSDAADRARDPATSDPIARFRAAKARLDAARAELEAADCEYGAARSVLEEIRNELEVSRNGPVSTVRERRRPPPVRYIDREQTIERLVSLGFDPVSNTGAYVLLRAAGRDARFYAHEKRATGCRLDANGPFSERLNTLAESSGVDTKGYLQWEGPALIELLDALEEEGIP